MFDCRLVVFTTLVELLRHDLIGSKKRAQETFLEHSKKRFSLCQNVVKNGSKNVLENGGLGIIAFLIKTTVPSLDARPPCDGAPLNPLMARAW